MNIYRYSLPIDNDGIISRRTLSVAMTPYDMKIFNHCLRNKIREGLDPLYDYLLYADLTLADDSVISLKRDNELTESDFVYRYSGEKKVYKFDVITPHDIDESISVYIQTPEILFDWINDLSNLGDIPEDLSDIINKKVKELGLQSKMDGMYQLECDKDADDSLIDYKWFC